MLNNKQDNNNSELGVLKLIVVVGEVEKSGNGETGREQKVIGSWSLVVFYVFHSVLRGRKLSKLSGTPSNAALGGSFVQQISRTISTIRLFSHHHHHTRLSNNAWATRRGLGRPQQPFRLPCLSVVTALATSLP